MASSYNQLFEVFKANLKKSYPAQKQLRRLGLGLNIGVGYNAQGWQHSKSHPLQHCLLFPLRRQNDKIVGFYGYPIKQPEAIKPGHRTNEVYFPKRTGFYPRYPNLYTERLLLTDHILNAARLWQIHKVWENYTVLACYSFHGLRQEQQQAIASLKALREVIFFFQTEATSETLAGMPATGVPATQKV
ncbi:MAG: hypothetical protein AAF632_29150 [Bacteroidota bacterium]